MNKFGLSKVFRFTSNMGNMGAMLIALVGFLPMAGAANAQGFQLIEATIEDVHGALRSGEISCRALVQSYLDRITAYDQQGPTLNAIAHINANALEEADLLDAALNMSRLVGPLHCIPVLLKDQVETREMPTTYGSAVFAGFVTGRDATIVTRMNEAGAIILAKTNMGEFASRYVGSGYGITRNAYDPTRNPSGSSGGTASGIAANFGMIGIGEDTGGSVRGPAAVSNLVGLRPSVPLVSRFGMMPATPTVDTLGPMTRSVEDAAILLDVLAGYDPNDPVSVYSVGHIPDTYQSFLDEAGLEGARIGVIRQPMGPRTDPESDDYKKVWAVMERAIDDIASLGAEIIDPVEINGLELVDSIYGGNVFETELAINDYLAGLPHAPVSSLEEILLTGKVTPWRAGRFANLMGRTASDPARLEVQKSAEEIRLNVLNMMAAAELDALLYATYDHQPTKIADDVLTNANTSDAYNIGNNRRFAPLLRFPAISVPAGFTEDDLPVGLELMGREFSEGMLLGFAYAYEQATKHRQPPATTPPL
jgi:amidase